MAEQARECPFCGAKAVSITGHSFRNGFFHNVGCLKCEVLFSDANKWNRRTPGPATQAIIEHLRQHLTDLEALDPNLDLANVGNPYLIVVKEFLDEWDQPISK